MSNRNIEKQGRDDFDKGKDDPKDNPYPRDSEQAKDWKRGNDEAYDDYRERHRDWYGPS